MKVVTFLRTLNGGLRNFDVQHRQVLGGPDGEFEIDAVAKFEALGVEFVILVECKHHKTPIKREAVQVLRDRLRSVRAQKGMLFATARFQTGAIEYAQSQGIALVHFTEGGPIYETKALGAPAGPTRPYDVYWVGLTAKRGMSYRFGAHDDLREYLFGDAR